MRINTMSVLLSISSLLVAAEPYSQNNAVLAPRETIWCPGSDRRQYTSANGQTYVIECGIDRDGTNMHSQPIYENHFAACIDMCSTMQGCVDVSFVPETGACWRKSSSGKPTTGGSKAWGAILVGDLGRMMDETSYDLGLDSTATESGMSIRQQSTAASAVGEVFEKDNSYDETSMKGNAAKRAGDGDFKFRSSHPHWNLDTPGLQLSPARNHNYCDAECRGKLSEKDFAKLFPDQPIATVVKPVYATHWPYAPTATVTKLIYRSRPHHQKHPKTSPGKSTTGGTARPTASPATSSFCNSSNCKSTSKCSSTLSTPTWIGHAEHTSTASKCSWLVPVHQTYGPKCTASASSRPTTSPRLTTKTTLVTQTVIETLTTVTTKTRSGHEYPLTTTYTLPIRTTYTKLVTIVRAEYITKTASTTTTATTPAYITRTVTTPSPGYSVFCTKSSQTQEPSRNRTTIDHSTTGITVSRTVAPWRNATTAPKVSGSSTHHHPHYNTTKSTISSTSRTSTKYPASTPMSLTGFMTITFSRTFTYPQTSGTQDYPASSHTSVINSTYTPIQTDVSSVISTPLWANTTYLTTWTRTRTAAPPSQTQTTSETSSSVTSPTRTVLPNTVGNPSSTQISTVIQSTTSPSALASTMPVLDRKVTTLFITAQQATRTLTVTYPPEPSARNGTPKVYTYTVVSPNTTISTVLTARATRTLETSSQDASLAARRQLQQPARADW